MKLVSFIFYWMLTSSSIYNLEFQTVDGATQSMSQFQGKKILLVNIATGSGRASQLAGLQQLHQQFGDSMVIIGFPTNSFGKESRSNAEIKQFCQSNYGVTFFLSSKCSVSGLQIHPIYNWLTNISENGMAGEPVGGDFQKYLINESGMLIGFFSPSIVPMSTQITDVLSNQ